MVEVAISDATDAGPLNRAWKIPISNTGGDNLTTTPARLVQHIGGVFARYFNFQGAGLFAGPLDMSGNAGLQQANISDTSAIGAASFAGDISLTRLTATSTNGLTSLDLTGCAALTYLNLAGSDLVNLDVSPCLALLELHIGTTGVTVLDISANINLATLECDGSVITDIDISNNPLLTFLSMTGCAITDPAKLDLILTTLDGYGLSNGYCGLANVPMGIPTATGITAKGSLEGKGWTVNVNS